MCVHSVHPLIQCFIFLNYFFQVDNFVSSWTQIGVKVKEGCLPKSLIICLPCSPVSHRMMSSKRATPQFPLVTEEEEEEEMGQDNVGWAKDDREGQDQPTTPPLRSKSHPEDLQQIRDNQPDSEWESIGPSLTVRELLT